MVKLATGSPSECDLGALTGIGVPPLGLDSGTSNYIDDLARWCRGVRPSIADDIVGSDVCDRLGC